MAIKEVDENVFRRPVELLRKDFDEFEKSNFNVVELVGYDCFKAQSVRTAAIKVMHEHGDSIKFFARNGKFYLAKD